MILVSSLLLLPEVACGERVITLFTVVVVVFVIPVDTSYVSAPIATFDKFVDRHFSSCAIYTNYLKYLMVFISTNHKDSF